MTELARKFHHLECQYKEEGPGDRNRRHLRHELDHLIDRFERLVARVGDPELRERWRQHFHHHEAAAPTVPSLPKLPARLFKGRSEVGSTLELCRRKGGMAEAVVDGSPLRRLPASAFRIVEEGGASHLALQDQQYREVFDVSEPAARALEEFVTRSGEEPPVEWTSELAEDGLIDIDYALTDRGRRLLRARAG